MDQQVTKFRHKVLMEDREMNIYEWEANKIVRNFRNSKWEDYKDKLPTRKTSYEDKYFVLERFCKELINNPMARNAYFGDAFKIN